MSKFDCIYQLKNWIQSFVVIMTYKSFERSTSYMKSGGVSYKKCTAINAFTSLLNCYQSFTSLLNCYQSFYIPIKLQTIAFNPYNYIFILLNSRLNGFVLHWLMKFDFWSHMSTFWPITWGYLNELNTM